MGLFATGVNSDLPDCAEKYMTQVHYTRSVIEYLEPTAIVVPELRSCLANQPMPGAPIQFQSAIEPIEDTVLGGRILQLGIGRNPFFKVFRCIRLGHDRPSPLCVDQCRCSQY